MEDALLFGKVGEEFEEFLSISGADAARTRANAIGEMGEPAGGNFAIHEDGEMTEGPGRIGPQKFAQLGQPKVAAWGLDEQTESGQGAHYPVKRRRVQTGLAREFFDRPWLAVHVIRYANAGNRGNAVAHVFTKEQLQHGIPRGRRVVRRC
jgi:hypothetical protein